MTDGTYWTKCFITSRTTTYCLLDDGGDVRATAFDLESIRNAKKHYGWGSIHKCSYKDGILDISMREVR